MELTELRKLTVKQLQDELLSSRKALFTLRIQRSTGQAPRPHSFKEIRKSIARILTVLTEKVNG